jgi:hypothetical protein
VRPAWPLVVVAARRAARLSFLRDHTVWYYVARSVGAWALGFGAAATAWGWPLVAGLPVLFAVMVAACLLCDLGAWAVDGATRGRAARQAWRRTADLPPDAPPAAPSAARLIRGGQRFELAIVREPHDCPGCGAPRFVLVPPPGVWLHPLDDVEVDDQPGDAHVLMAVRLPEAGL